MRSISSIQNFHLNNPDQQKFQKPVNLQNDMSDSIESLLGKLVPSPACPELVEGERACPKLAEGGWGEVIQKGGS